MISGLSDEQERWSKDVKRLKEDSTLIAGNCVIGAGMIAYSGPFTAEFRNRFEKLRENKLKEMQLEHTEGNTLQKMFSLKKK